MKLKKIEPIVLANQFRIVACLQPEEAEIYEQYEGVLTHGFSRLYADDFQSISEKMSESVQEFVLQVLNLHAELTTSVSQLSNPLNSLEDEVQSKGFDGNNESELMNFAHFVVVKMKRFQQLNLNEESEVNSHTPMSQRYEKMLEIRAEIDEDYGQLSEGSIRKILE